MIYRLNIKDSSWIDLASPDEAEIQKISQEYDFDYIISQDLLSPTPNPRTFEGSKFLYTIFHIPVFKHSHRNGDVQEIDFIIGRKVVATTRYESIDALDKFRKEAEVQEILGKGNITESHIFYALMKEIQGSLFDELAYIEDWLSAIEIKIFSGLEKEMVFTLSEASRNILNFKKTIAPHGEIFDFLESRGKHHFGEKFARDIAELKKNWERINETARNHGEMLAELRETNNSILSTKENETMKVLTIMTFVTLPLSLIAAIFGMDTKWTPIVGSEHDFATIMSIMGCITLLMLAFFKHRKWL